MIDAEIKVGIADLNTVSYPDKIMTIGLGSCVGIAIFDKIKLIGGLSHIMLPDSTQFKDVKNPYKFADLAIPILIEKMEKLGCQKRNMTVKIAGGASMFNFSDKSMISDIGKRNGEAVVKTLKQLQLQVLASHLGGNKGRTMVLDSKTGKVIIKIVGQGIIEL
jgi:chemotaxis protein CheD